MGAYICLIDKDDNLRAMYVHKLSSPDKIGEILCDNYGTYSKISPLIELKQINYLGYRPTLCNSIDGYIEGECMGIDGFIPNLIFSAKNLPAFIQLVHDQVDYIYYYSKIEPYWCVYDTKEQEHHIL